MNYDPQKNNRKSIRLKNYDYAQEGWYFVTICTKNRIHLFGKISNRQMKLNDQGKIVSGKWNEIPQHYPNVELDEFIVMPNHIHGILHITYTVGVQNVEPLQNVESLQNRVNRYQHIIPGSVGSIIRGFKIGVTKWFRKNTDIHNVWQRNFWENIVRNETDLVRIREYIKHNPAKWIDDKFHN